MLFSFACLHWLMTLMWLSENPWSTVRNTLGFILVFQRVLYNSVKCKGAKQNKNSQNFQILSFVLSIFGLCCSVQTTVDHFFSVLRRCYQISCVQKLLRKVKFTRCNFGNNGPETSIAVIVLLSRAPPKSLSNAKEIRSYTYPFNKHWNKQNNRWLNFLTSGIFRIIC